MHIMGLDKVAETTDETGHKVHIAPASSGPIHMAEQVNEMPHHFKYTDSGMAVAPGATKYTDPAPGQTNYGDDGTVAA